MDVQGIGSWAERDAGVQELLHEVGLDTRSADLSHEFSGGNANAWRCNANRACPGADPCQEEKRRRACFDHSQ